MSWIAWSDPSATIRHPSGCRTWLLGCESSPFNTWTRQAIPPHQRASSADAGMTICSDAVRATLSSLSFRRPVMQRCVAVPGIDSVEQYTIAIAVGRVPDPPRGGRQRFSSSRLRGRHRSSAQSHRIDDVLDSQQLCAHGRNDRTYWVMLTTGAAHCPTVRRLRSSGDGQRKVLRHAY